MRVLVAAGVDVSARDGAFHATAAGWAEFAGDAEVVALLDDPVSPRRVRP